MTYLIMRCATICLLTFCAFEAVLADETRQNLENLYNTSMSKVYSIVDRLRVIVTATFKVADTKRIGPKGDICEEEYDALMKFLNVVTFKRINDCCDQAAKHMNVKLAEECFDNAVTAIDNEAKLRRSNFFFCIAKYLPEAAAEGEKRISFEADFWEMGLKIFHLTTIHQQDLVNKVSSYPKMTRISVEALQDKLLAL